MEAIETHAGEKIPAPEWLQWPYMVKPTLPEIVETARQVLGIQPGSDFITGRVHGCRQRDPLSLIWRQVAFSVARSVRGISSPEFAKKIGLASHTNFTDRGFWFTKFRDSNAGIALHNEVVYCLMKKEVGRATG